MTNNVVALRKTNIDYPQHMSAVIVAGSGGASSTTTTFGLATALRLATGTEVAAIDGTSDGGNLLDRTRTGPIDHPRAIRQLRSRMAVSSAGVVVVGHSGGGDPALVDGLFADRDAARFHDVGPGLFTGRLTGLIESGAAVVVVSPVRAEPLSRMRTALTRLIEVHGSDILSRTVVVLSHQSPEIIVDPTPICQALAPRLAAFVEVPFDEVLARPGRLDHRQLSAATLEAWADVLDALGRFTDARYRAETGEANGVLA